ncbi:hypothetical protein HRbin04_00909 [archaeon HR04]|nr:hypothetical protein HRbin04_00909 [archaeon HR04]
MENIIAVYCNSSNTTSKDINSQDIPRHVRNRLDTASNLFSRLARSHADDSVVRTIFFARSKDEAELYARLSSLPDARVEECINIEDMVKKVLATVGFYERRKDKAGKEMLNISTSKRVYFVLSNWQWQYIEPLLRLKDQQFRFFFEGALDERGVEEIEADRRMESVIKLKVENSIVDRFMGILASDLKG